MDLVSESASGNPVRGGEIWLDWAKSEINPTFDRYPDLRNAVVAELKKAVCRKSSHNSLQISKSESWSRLKRLWCRPGRGLNGPPSVVDCEVVRLLNGGWLPEFLVTSLREGGWHPLKCCDPSLAPVQKRERRPQAQYKPRPETLLGGPSASGGLFSPSNTTGGTVTTDQATSSASGCSAALYTSSPRAIIMNNKAKNRSAPEHALPALAVMRTDPPSSPVGRIKRESSSAETHSIVQNPAPTPFALTSILRPINPFDTNQTSRYRANANETKKETDSPDPGTAHATTNGIPNDGEYRGLRTDTLKKDESEIERLSNSFTANLRSMLHQHIRTEIEKMSEESTDKVQQKIRDVLSREQNAHLGFATLRDVEDHTLENLRKEISTVTEALLKQIDAPAKDSAGKNGKRKIGEPIDGASADEKKGAKRRRNRKA